MGNWKPANISDLQSLGTVQATAARRLLAFGADWLVILAWAGLLFGMVTVLAGGIPNPPASPWTAQGIGFLTMTMPVVLYFSIAESAATRATLGKWTLGLVVIQMTGGRLSFGGALLRNAIKFAPWELGHTLANQAAFSGPDGLPDWAWVPAVAASVGPVWWIVSMFHTGRTPYDRLALAAVTRNTDQSRLTEPFDPRS